MPLRFHGTLLAGLRRALDFQPDLQLLCLPPRECSDSLSLVAQGCQMSVRGVQGQVCRPRCAGPGVQGQEA